MKNKLQVGDWVRFYRSGELVIAVIEYITKDNILGELIYHTTLGNITEEYILECRPKSS